MAEVAIKGPLVFIQKLNWFNKQMEYDKDHLVKIEDIIQDAVYESLVDDSDAGSIDADAFIEEIRSRSERLRSEFAFSVIKGKNHVATMMMVQELIKLSQDEEY